jgi:hypothetical protein
MTTKEEKKITNEKPVSLFPLPFEKALNAFLKVKPKPKEKKKRTRKQTKKSSD